MKKIPFLFIALFLFGSLSAQDFNKKLSEAKVSYASGKLDDSRFAMQQMLQELDIITGKEVLKVLPAKLNELPASKDKDNVSGASGFLGVVIHREYGTEAKNISLEIIGNSPMLTAINALLSLPLIANNGDQKVIKISGYKGLVQKVSGDNNTTNYELQLPLNSSLVTIKAPGYTQDEVIKIAGSLPISEIAKMVQ